MKNSFIINNTSSNIVQLGEKEKTTYPKLIESCEEYIPKILND